MSLKLWTLIALLIFFFNFMDLKKKKMNENFQKPKTTSFYLACNGKSSNFYSYDIINEL